jgi:hypothetical protein
MAVDEEGCKGGSFGPRTLQAEGRSVRPTHQPGAPLFSRPDGKVCDEALLVYAKEAAPCTVSTIEEIFEALKALRDEFDASTLGRVLFDLDYSEIILAASMVHKGIFRQGYVLKAVP